MRRFTSTTISSVITLQPESDWLWTTYRVWRTFTVLPGRMVMNFKNTTSVKNSPNLLSTKRKSKYLENVLISYLRSESTDPICVDSEWPFRRPTSSVSYKVSPNDTEKGYFLPFYIGFKEISDMHEKFQTIIFSTLFFTIRTMNLNKRVKHCQI